MCVFLWLVILHVIVMDHHQSLKQWTVIHSLTLVCLAVKQWTVIHSLTLVCLAVTIVTKQQYKFVIMMMRSSWNVGLQAYADDTQVFLVFTLQASCHGQCKLCSM